MRSSEFTHFWTVQTQNFGGEMAIFSTTKLFFKLCRRWWNSFFFPFYPFPHVCNLWYEIVTLKYYLPKCCQSSTMLIIIWKISSQLWLSNFGNDWQTLSRMLQVFATVTSNMFLKYEYFYPSLRAQKTRSRRARRRWSRPPRPPRRPRPAWGRARWSPRSSSPTTWGSLDGRGGRRVISNFLQAIAKQIEIKILKSGRRPSPTLKEIWPGPCWTDHDKVSGPAGIWRFNWTTSLICSRHF